MPDKSEVSVKEERAEAYYAFIVNECLRLGVPESDMPNWMPFDQLVQTLETACQKSSWQPMATAPRDGREVLLKVERRAGMPHCTLVGHYMEGGHCIEDHPAIDSGWYFWNGCMFDKASKPTSWMPLPPHADAPPAAPASEAELLLKSDVIAAIQEALGDWGGPERSTFDAAMRAVIAELAKLPRRPAGGDEGERERAWLVERKSGGIPEWLYVHNEFFQWTRDSLLAIRFCRREDADQVAAVIGEDAEYVTEHKWGP